MALGTVDKTVGSAIPLDGPGKSYVMSNIVDFSDTDLSGLASTDIIQCLDIPAKTMVYDVFVEIVTASVATTLTGTVGDAADPNGWDAAVDFEAAAETITKAATGTDAYATSNGKFYDAADTIDVVATVTSITTEGSFKVTATCASIG